LSPSRTLRRFASALPFFLVPLVGISCWEPQAQPATEPPAPSAAAPPGAVYEGEAFTFQEIQPGIYHAVGTGNLSVGCNGSIFVNEDDVLIVDSHITPAAAWALPFQATRTRWPKSGDGQELGTISAGWPESAS